jgi:hypothetical protein
MRILRRRLSVRRLLTTHRSSPPRTALSAESSRGTSPTRIKQGTENRPDDAIAAHVCATYSS